jgi:uncharacterized protein involved in response to NO
MITIQPKYAGKTAFLHLGFRPFFFAALAFSVISMTLWMFIYSFGVPILPSRYPGVIWHAHEMIYGFTGAVVSGFLLTAVKNWTGIQTINHKPLLLVVLLWLAARSLVFFPSTSAFYAMAVADCLFFLVITIAFSFPVIKTRQWSNLAFSGKLALLFVANMVFYLGLLGFYNNGISYGLYGGFYVVLAIIFNMGRRVIPFFIEKGLGCPFTAKNYRWVDLSSLLFFLFFALADIIKPDSKVVAILAAVLVLIHATRLYGWYHKGIWNKSLLWGLYVGYAWIVLGFALKVPAAFGLLHGNLALHAFAYGGIGLITTGMMARVSLGHTGNNVFKPPRILNPIFILLFAGTFIRVILPIFLQAYYPLLIIISQLLWITAFALFFIKYAPMLIKARADGQFG